MNLFKDNKNEYFEQDFLDVNFSGLGLAEKVFDSCAFDNCDFTEGNFERCKFISCTFTNCNLSLIKIKETSFWESSFYDSKLVGINWAEAKWSIVKLPCSLQFFNCILDHSSFFGLYLREIVIHKCSVREVDFREADLSLSDMEYSDFHEAWFIKTDLSGANFSYALNYAIDITQNKIKKAQFMLPEAMGLLYGLEVILVEG